MQITKVALVVLIILVAGIVLYGAYVSYIEPKADSKNNCRDDVRYNPNNKSYSYDFRFFETQLEALDYCMRTNKQ